MANTSIPTGGDTPVRALAALRIAAGAGAWLAPTLTVRAFGVQAAAATPLSTLMGRLFGVRDVALGVLALTGTGDARTKVLQVGVVCDLADVAAALLAGRGGGIPKLAVAAISAAGLAAVASGGAALRRP